MRKPTKKTIKALDWHECTDFIEKKHKIQTRDFARSHGQFDEWADAQGYGATDREAKGRGDSQVWYSEYQRAVEKGEVVERPYQDFWHFICDTLQPARGGFIELYPDLGEKAEPWQEKILALYLAEFGEGPYHCDW